MKDPMFRDVTYYHPDDIPHAIFAVATGIVVAAVVKNVLDQNTCNILSETVLRESNKRTGEVNGSSYGPSLFEHMAKPKDYFLKASYFNKELNEKILSQFPVSVLEGYEEYNSYADCSITPLEMYGQAAPLFRGLVFENKGVVLKPHEDLAPLQSMNLLGINEDLPISNLTHVLAQNFYLRNQEGNGVLRLYDYVPTLEDRVRLSRLNRSDLAFTGYDYPQDLLKTKRSFDIVPEEGDLVILRSDLAHMVINESSKVDDYRISLNSFLGPVENLDSSSKLSFWT